MSNNCPDCNAPLVSLVCYHDIDDGNIRVFYYDAPAETYVRNMINGFLILKLNKLVLIDTMEKAEKFVMLL